MNKFNYTNLTPFKWFVLENFPFIEADFDALTEWQLFCKLGKELNKIINSENTLGTQVENVTNAFIKLQNYVNNYFDNLDVQEEINNKLNEMAEDGSLTVLIKNYIDPIYQQYENEINDQINIQNNNINNINSKVNSVASGSPSGVYNTLNDLETANPDHSKIYLVLEDGKWYYYNNSWIAGGIYQSARLDDNSISYEKLDTLLKETNPFNNLFEPFILNNNLNFENYNLYNDATIEIVNKPDNMNCNDEKVLKITLPRNGSYLAIFPKFRQEIEYGKNLSFSHYIHYTNNSYSYRYFMYRDTKSVIDLNLGYSINEFKPINIPLENVQPNDNLNIRFFNFGENEQIIYLADNVAIYGNKSINENIGYNKKVLPKNIIPSFETNKIGVGFGDSIMEGFGVLTPNKLPTEDCISVMSKYLNTPIYNGGIGGAKLSSGNCSFVEIVDSLISGEWTNFDTNLNELINKNANMTSAIIQYNKIKSLDFSKVDFLAIAYGTNDWTAGRRLENIDNPMDKYTICGALRYCVSNLLTKYPQLKLYVFTPCYRDHLGTNQDETSDTFINPTSNLKLTDVCDGIENTCKELHIPCKNMYYDSNLNKYTRNEYLSDYVHRNAKGYELMGKQYAKFVDSN